MEEIISIDIKRVVIKLLSEHKTPFWTLIGVMIGFVFSYLYNLTVQRRQYTARVQETIERIKKSMRLTNSRQAIQRIADLIPQFREREQIEILSEIGLESSLNADSDDVTQCVIEELKWIGVLYELEPNIRHNLVEKSRKDENRVTSIRNALWDLSLNIVEYRQSEKLLRITFDLLDTLNRYSITQGYEEVIASSIELYKNIGELSVGIKYPSGYKVLNFQFGINKSITRLCSLRQSLRQSPFKNSKVSKLSNEIDNAIQMIKKEHSQKVS